MNNQISIAEELMKLKMLLDDGTLTQEEFDVQKKKLLNGSSQSQVQNSPKPQAPPTYQQPNIIINNKNTNINRNVVGGGRRRYSLGFDIFMICITGGLWIFWMIFRPKYY